MGNPGSGLGEDKKCDMYFYGGVKLTNVLQMYYPVCFRIFEICSLNFKICMRIPLLIYKSIHYK